MKKNKNTNKSYYMEPKTINPKSIFSKNNKKNNKANITRNTKSIYLKEDTPSVSNRRRSF